MSEIIVFDENLWLIEVSLMSYDVRGALIIGSERAMLWDTLSHPNDMKPLRAILARKDLFVVYSHADWDHIWGTAGLSSQYSLLIGHAACRERFRTDVPVTLYEKQAAEPMLWNEVKLIAPNITFQQELSLDLGGCPVTLRHLPGHTPDSIVAFLPKRGILFLGDAVETPFPVVPKACPLPAWIAELQRWEDDSRVHTVIPSHGVIGGREILQRNIIYLQHLLDGRPMTIPETLPEFYRETHRMNVASWRGAS